ncbi:MAG TPA: metallophosphoesterase [Burkholderiaceae bacterium]|jgi:3',5'-cyclic AMP phosphodiesterase CpdA
MIDRRNFMRLAAVGGGAVFMSGLPGQAMAALAGKTVQRGSAQLNGVQDFYFIQMSDTHWGYSGKANPDAANTLKTAVATINALEVPPDFIVFTGDLTHTTDDPAERRRRIAEFRAIVGELKVQAVHCIPGEHDASLDGGEAFQESFGDMHFAFNNKGVHFIGLDNASDPEGKLGTTQLEWLKTTLAGYAKSARIVVFAHRPLFELAPQWGWGTPDGDKALALLAPYANVTVFYGHIHQEYHYQTGNIKHHSAKSLMYPFPAPGSQANLTPLSWDAASPYKGLGFREVATEAKSGKYIVSELPVKVG